MFFDALNRLLEDQAGPAVVRAIEAGGDPGMLKAALEQSGFLELMAQESLGGADLPLSEVFDLLVLFGRHATPVPVAHTIAIRGRLRGTGLAPPVGMITTASALIADGDRWVAADTPFGLTADHVLAATDAGRFVVLDARNAERITSGVRGRLNATLVWQALDDAPSVEGRREDILVFGAAVHSALLVGALTRTFELTLAYCNDRAQFGRSIGRFQAVQHQLAVMAEAVAAARFAAMAAFTSGYRPDPTGAAIAKARTSEAVSLVASTAHALHGAIGVTEEYDLQLFTRRLHEWRTADGSERYWQTWLGEEFLKSGQPSLARHVQRLG